MPAKTAVASAEEPEREPKPTTVYQWLERGRWEPFTGTAGIVTTTAQNLTFNTALTTASDTWPRGHS